MEKFAQPSEEIQVLIVEFLEGKINDHDLKILNNWIAESNEHLRQFNSLKSSWLLGGKSVHLSTEKTKVALKKVKQSLQQKSGKILSAWSFSRIAASWLFFLVVGGSIGVYVSRGFKTNELQNRLISVTAPLGSKSLVDLPDGTKVWLNAGSKISYNTNYGEKTREVTLTGEAYFNVVTNKNMPFLVQTSDVTVKAVGTKFNVKAYAEEKTITTTLEEGKIILTESTDSKSKKSFVLKPKEMLIFYKEGNKSVASSLDKSKPNITKLKEEVKEISIKPDVRTELVTSWKDETWIIEAQPLGILAPVLERRYNTSIVFESEDLRKYKFTGKIQTESIEQIMKALELSAPINYKINRNTVDISLNKMRLEQFNQNTYN